MRRIIVSTYVTLDGLYVDPTEWSLPYFDEGAEEYARTLLWGADALLMGRITYEGFAESWTPREGEFADRFNAMPKYVASRTLSAPLTWHNSRLIDGDLVDRVQQLKQEGDGSLLMYGTGPVSIALMNAGLVDEHHTWVHPVVWGGDEPRLFESGLDRLSFELAGTTTTPSGIVILAHRPLAA
jgi:dihydrofolate reductase